jgi:hypothetical protein
MQSLLDVLSMGRDTPPVAHDTEPTEPTTSGASPCDARMERIASRARCTRARRYSVAFGITELRS